MKNLFSLFLILLLACNNKQPALVDYEIDIGIVIGQEICKTDLEQNAWLIKLNATQKKNYGKPITFQGVNYDNVVKVYDISKDFQKINTKCLVFFYTGSLNSPKNCNVSNPTIFEIPEIFIKDISPTL